MLLPGDGIAMTGYFGQHAERLAAYGYDVIPISLPTYGGNSPGKRPAQSQGWTEGLRREAWPAFARYGLGIITRNTPALDIDLRDPWLAERPIAEPQAPAGAPSARGLPDLPDPVQYDRAEAIRIARELLDHIERGTRDRPTLSAYLHDVAEVACIEEHLLATGGLATVSVEGEGMSAPLPPDVVLGEPTDEELLTNWERRFLASVDAWDGELTERQQEKLDEIEESLERRRELCRQGLWPRCVR